MVAQNELSVSCSSLLTVIRSLHCDSDDEFFLSSHSSKQCFYSVDDLWSNATFFLSVSVHLCPWVSGSEMVFFVVA